MLDTKLFQLGLMLLEQGDGSVRVITQYIMIGISGATTSPSSVNAPRAAPLAVPPDPAHIATPRGRSGLRAWSPIRAPRRAWRRASPECGSARRSPRPSPDIRPG